VGRTLALPFAALLGGFGALLALSVLLVALFVATIGWNPVGAAVAHVRGRCAAWRSARTAAGAARPRPSRSRSPRHCRSVPVPRRERRWGAGTRALRRGGVAGDEAAAAEEGEAGWYRAGGHGRPGLDGAAAAHAAERAAAGDTALSNEHFDRLGQVLIETLRTFKVEGQIGGRTTGPVVTQFEVVPAPGVKVNRIAALDADLALALRAPSIRIVAPIPAKAPSASRCRTRSRRWSTCGASWRRRRSSARAARCRWRWART
jgi:DNA segregation ATPase FtsK/SpoIIIE, S-DNA-T family